MNETIEKKCLAKGVKLTEQRKIIAKVMSSSKDHPDVDELYNDEEQIELKKLKTSTLTDFYNCYKSNQVQFKEVKPVPKKR